MKVIKKFLEHSNYTNWKEITDDDFYFSNKHIINFTRYDLESISSVVNNTKYKGMFDQNILDADISKELAISFDILHNDISVGDKFYVNLYYYIIIKKAEDDYYKVCISINDSDKVVFLLCDQIDNLIYLLSKLQDYLYNKYNSVYEDLKYYIQQFILKYDILNNNMNNDNIRKILNIK